MPEASAVPAAPASVDRGTTALVLTGGGARGAYQVGCLRWIARRWPAFQPRVITGVSAGAINAAHLAGHPGDFNAATTDLVALWDSLRTEDVFRTDLRSLLGHTLHWAWRLASGQRAGTKRMRGMVDTAPLRRTLAAALPLEQDRLVGISRNILAGRLDAAALSTTSYATGQTISWVEGKGVQPWTYANRSARLTPLTLDHIMASAALPLVFPAVSLPDGFHGDGGVRQTAPLSPALHLGAHKILAVSPLFVRPYGEPNRDVVTAYPTPARIMGVLFNAVFLDALDFDARQLQRISAMARLLPPEQRQGLRPVDVLVLRPSRDLGRVAAEYASELPRAFRWFEQRLGSEQGRTADTLSMLLFEQAYLRVLIAMGEHDTAQRAEEIEAFLFG